MPTLTSAKLEAVQRFPCFGGRCAVLVGGSGPRGSAFEAAALARRRLEGWHQQFSRFEPRSELSRLNADPRATIRVSTAMALFVKAALGAAALTGGLVDPTLADSIEEAGYTGDLDSRCLPVAEALALAPPRRPAAPAPAARWRQVSVDARTRTLTRQPGIRLDSGGLAKGLFGDLLAAALGEHRAFAVDAAGDVRVGGSAGLPRAVEVQSPFDSSIIHSFELVDGAAATSGISKRSWLDSRGRPSHHLLDPSTGKPAFTGVIQATALAPTGTEAEALSKAAVLSGPEGAATWLPHGGLLVFDDGSAELYE
jgi:thiamine biosynthesis lipoprotein